jgi:hypothetical protein
MRKQVTQQDIEEASESLNMIMDDGCTERQYLMQVKRIQRLEKQYHEQQTQELQ